MNGGRELEVEGPLMTQAVLSAAIFRSATYKAIYDKIVILHNYFTASIFQVLWQKLQVLIKKTTSTLEGLLLQKQLITYNYKLRVPKIKLE